MAENLIPASDVVAFVIKREKVVGAAGPKRYYVGHIILHTHALHMTKVKWGTTATRRVIHTKMARDSLILDVEASREP